MTTHRPNILLITTDQQRFDTIASLGNDHIYTPHLDWLADEGIAFTRAYSDCPICMPARATIMVGKHGFTMGLTGNSHAVKPLAVNPTLPGLLTSAGYQTRAQGKMHFEPMRANYGFEHMELPMEYYRACNRNSRDGLPKDHGVGENEITPVISTVHESQSLTHWTVERSIDFLETRDETRPFFLWTSFTKPHPPLDPCANYWELYRGKDMPEPVLGDWSQNVQEMPQNFLQPTYCLNNAYRAAKTALADMKRAYYACITQIDYQLGMLFARMRELNLLENTWILFTSDHGEMLGDHHMAAKTVFMEGSAHIPLLLRPPAAPWDAKPLAGKRVEQMVTLADVMPTLLDLAGVVAPEDLEGRNLLDIANSDNPDRVFHGESTGIHCVMRERIKYQWSAAGGDELLFDLMNDPFEKKNLIGKDDWAEKKAELRALLIKRLQGEGSPLVKDGELTPGKGISGPKDVSKWPGFHSTVHPDDVLH